MFKLKQQPQSAAEILKEQQFRKLCQLCSPNFSKEDILASEIDWPVVWKLALRHRVVPVMADRIKTLNIPVPDEFAELITSNVQQNLYKGMRQSAEIIELAELFEKHDIKFLVFKGIALMKITGLELHQRHHGDIDILLKNKDDFFLAKKLLKCKGYKTYGQKISNLDKKKHAQFLKKTKDIGFYNLNKKIKIELHLKININKKLLEEDLEEIFRESFFFKISSKKIPTFSKKYYSIYLPTHGAFSRWCRLKWLIDIDLAKRNFNSHSAKKIIKEKGLNRVCKQSNYFYKLFLTKSPVNKRNTKVQERILISIAMKHIFGKVIWNQKFENKASAIRFLFYNTLTYNLLLKPGLKYKIELIKSYGTNHHDWEVLDLPDTLFFLYYPLRPYLWLKRHL